MMIEKAIGYVTILKSLPTVASFMHLIFIFLSFKTRNTMEEVLESLYNEIRK